MADGAITFDTLVSDLRGIGLRESDIVYVHSSMKKVGWIEGGIVTLVEAFLHVLGSEGTLAVPTHTYSFTGKDEPPFDRENSICQTGAFCEAVRKYPGAKRSGNASHSSAAVGKLAEYITSNHDPANAVGYESPLYRIYVSGGKVLLLGVSQVSNTMIHLAEFLSGVPYTDLHYDSSWNNSTHEILADGTIVETVQTKFCGCSGKFKIMDEILSAAGAMTRGMIGDADSRLIDAKYMVDAATELIKKTPEIFFCDNARCPCCPPRRAYMKEKGY